MTQPRVLILRAPGTNCDEETAYAFERAGGRPQTLHVNRLLEKPALFGEFQIACLPGGFSYGDDIAAGRILGSQLRHHLADSLAEFKSAGKLILGICNGFQVLIQTGVLFDADEECRPPATLTWNDSGRFEDRWVDLAPVQKDTIFFARIESMRLPVAHAEGKFVTRDRETRDRLEEKGLIALRYQGPTGQTGDHVEYPANPNGSEGAVAGVTDSTGHVCGLMPHPERFIVGTQHPQWTRHKRQRAGDGLRLFENAVRYFQ